jgi:hypothetical protein
VMPGARRVRGDDMQTPVPKPVGDRARIGPRSPDQHLDPEVSEP